MHIGEASTTGREGRGHAAAVLLAVMVIVVLIALPFVPLLLSLIERVLFGSNHVEDVCRQIGIHDELGELYEWVFRLFK